MKTSRLFVVALTMGLCAPAVAADYAFDIKGQHASIQFRIKHLGYSWLNGRFDKFDGVISYDPKSVEASKVKVDIDTTSLNSNHGERDKHLRSPEFLDVAQFPKATFESTSVKSTGDGKADITGKLTLHGVTKDVTIKAERLGGGPDPWGGTREGFTGTTRIVLADFGMTHDLGPASKEVELFLDVEGVLKK